MAQQTITQRLMQVAIELEDERYAQARKYDQLTEDLSQRLASAELQKTQAQLAVYRLEEQLLEAKAQNTALENALHSTEDEVDRLRSDEADRSGRDAHLGRINELMRELIATRFHLAAYVARDSQQQRAGADASSSPKGAGGAGGGGASGWYPVPDPGAAAGGGGALHAPLTCGADGLMQAARALDVGAATAILSPSCLLAPPSEEAEPAAAAAPAAAPPPAPAAAQHLDALLGATLHVCLGAAAATSGGAAAPANGAPAPSALPSAEAASTIAEALLLRGAPVEWVDQASGERPLHAACRAGSVASASLLLEHGAAVGSRDARGRSALHLAVGAGAAELVPDAPDARSPPRPRPRPPLPPAPPPPPACRPPFRGARLRLASISPRAPLPPSAPPPLQVRYLLQQGADPEAQDDEGGTAEAVATGLAEEARLPVLAALRDPTLKLVSKATAAGRKRPAPLQRARPNRPPPPDDAGCLALAGWGSPFGLANVFAALHHRRRRQAKAANGLYRAGEYAQATAAYLDALQVAFVHSPDRDRHPASEGRVRGRFCCRGLLLPSPRPLHAAAAAAAARPTPAAASPPAPPPSAPPLCPAAPRASAPPPRTPRPRRWRAPRRRRATSTTSPRSTSTARGRRSRRAGTSLRSSRRRARWCGAPTTPTR